MHSSNYFTQLLCLVSFFLLPHTHAFEVNIANTLSLKKDGDHFILQKIDNYRPSQLSVQAPIARLARAIGDQSWTISLNNTSDNVFIISFPHTMPYGLEAIIVQTLAAINPATYPTTNDTSPGENLFLQELLDAMDNDMSENAENTYGIGLAFTLLNVFSPNFCSTLADMVARGRLSPATVPIAGNFPANGDAIQVSTAHTMQLFSVETNAFISYNRTAVDLNYSDASLPSATLTPVSQIKKSQFGYNGGFSVTTQDTLRYIHDEDATAPTTLFGSIIKWFTDTSYSPDKVKKEAVKKEAYQFYRQEFSALRVFL